MRIIKLSLCVLASFTLMGLLGCSGTKTASDDKPAANSASNTKPAESKPEAKPTEKAPATAEKIGVEECDEYIEKYEACLMDKVPEAQRAMYKPGLDQMRKSWKDAAANPQTKSALASGCKTALEAAKTSMASFSCKW